MFIRTSTYDALVKRIEALEAQLKDGKHSEDALRFKVYESLPENYNHWHPLPLREKVISVKDAILKIMAHFGLEMKYVPGKPERVAVVEIAKTVKEKK